MAARSSYAVREGRKPGIYSSWKECKEEVNGFANAIYKKFDTRKQAEKFLADTAKKEAIMVGKHDHRDTHAQVNVNPPNSQSRTKQALYCICQKPNDGNTYVECGQCMEWYHPKCVGIQESKSKSLPYACFKCIEKDLMNISASLLVENITRDELLSEEEVLDDLILSNDQMQSLCTQIVELEEMVMKKQSIISTQEDKITQLKNDLKLKRTEIEKKDCEIANQHGKVKSLEKENKKVSESVETTLTQFSRLRKENAKMKEDLQVKAGRIEALQSTIKSMEKVNHHLEKENEAHVNLVQSMTELPEFNKVRWSRK